MGNYPKSILFMRGGVCQTNTDCLGLRMKTLVVPPMTGNEDLLGAKLHTICIAREGALVKGLQDVTAKYPLESTWSNMWSPNPLLLLSSLFCHLS